ncbi:MAG: AEC family transporter [Thermoanaerobacteraceae bacterium]|nr:AEC family transporter [Thermoanaerobacteraceae bacterium]
MTELLSLGLEIGVLFVYIFFGWLGRRTGILDAGADKAVSNLVFYFTMPALTVTSMGQKISTGQLYEGLFILAGSLVLVTLSYLFIVPVSRLLRVDGSLEESFRFGTIFGNVTYMGFPVCYMLFGKIGIFYAALYSLGHNLIFWTLGVWMICRRQGAGLPWREVLNINVIAIIAGFLLALGQIQLPRIIFEPLSGLGEATIPLAMLLIGSMLAEGNFKELVTSKLVYQSTAIKLLVLPALTLLLLRALPSLSTAGKTVMLLEMAMPAAALAPTVARKYNGAYVFLSRVVVFTTLLSLLTLPVFAWLGQR